MTVKAVWEGKYLRALKDGKWEYIERVNAKDAAIIIPILMNNNQRHLVFIKEYRVPIGQYIVGFPAGLIGDLDADETIADGANRELEEETGYKAQHMKSMFSGYWSPGLCGSNIHFYIATGLNKVGSGGGIDGEDISVHVVPINKVRTWLEGVSVNCAIDPKIYAAFEFIDTFYNDGEKHVF